LGDSPSKSGNKRPSFTEKKAWGRAQQEIGAVLDPEAMQPVVRFEKCILHVVILIQGSLVTYDIDADVIIILKSVKI
jgi:hypothetical protein